MFRNKLLVLSFCAGQVFAADSPPIPLQETERQFQNFIASLKAAVQKKNSRAVYAVLAPDYYVARDFGGSFDPSASPTRNFSANFELNNDNLRPEYKNFGWIEFKRAISGQRFER